MNDAIRKQLLEIKDFTEFKTFCKKNSITTKDLDLELVKHFGSLMKTPGLIPSCSPPDLHEAFVK